MQRVISAAWPSGGERLIEKQGLYYYKNTEKLAKKNQPEKYDSEKQKINYFKKTEIITPKNEVNAIFFSSLFTYCLQILWQSLFVYYLWHFEDGVLSNNQILLL